MTDEVPKYLAAETEVTIKNKKTGAIYKEDKEWKDLGVAEEDIQTDVLNKAPRLDLYGKTK